VKQREGEQRLIRLKTQGVSSLTLESSGQASMDTWTRTCLGIIGIGGCEYATEPVMLSKKVPRDWDDMLGGESACSLSENREKSVCAEA
jgi:hypothetical protein